MSKPTVQPTSERSLVAQAKALAHLLEREFAVPFLVFESATGACLNRGTDQPDAPLGLLAPAGEDPENDVCVSIASDGSFHLCLRFERLSGAKFIARARMTYGLTSTPIADAVLHLQQRVLFRWLSAFRDRLRLGDQHRKK